VLFHVIRRQEGGKEEVCIRTGSLDSLYAEEKERLRTNKSDTYLQQYAFLIQ